MKQYKEDLLKGFKKRNFELSELLDGNSLTWWIEEKWILKVKNYNSRNGEIYVIFATDKQRENGTKIVDEILVSASEMENSSDFSTTIAKLDMRKAIFSEKIEQFWTEFDNKNNL